MENNIVTFVHIFSLFLLDISDTEKWYERKYDLDTVIKMTSLILFPDFQTYVIQGHSAHLYYVDVYKLQ